MASGRRFRAYPSKAAKAVLASWMGARDFVWNAKWAERGMWRSLSKLDARRYPEHRDWPKQDAAYAWIAGSPETAWLKEIPSQILRNSAAEFVAAVNRRVRGLGGEPKAKRAGGKRSVWITRELFRFRLDARGELLVEIGTEAKPLFSFPATASRGFEPPASIRITAEGNAWFVSFSSGGGAEDEFPEAREETAARLAQLDPRELMDRSWGGDRGVAIPLAGSDGLKVDFSAGQKERMAEKHKKAKRHQRKFARQSMGYAKQKAAAATKGEPLPRTSGRQKKTLAKLAKCKKYAAHVRDDVAHKATARLADDPRYDAYAMERLNIGGMVKAPAAKPDPAKPGRFLPNQAAAKAGLSRWIHAAMWGRFATFLEYKAGARRKLFVLVDARNTSRECSQCGSVHPGNRPSQAEFACQACGHSDNADLNAARVVKARMVALVLSGGVGAAPKAKRIVARRGPKAAAERRGGDEPRPGEGRGGGGPRPVPQASTKRESSPFMAG